MTLASSMFCKVESRAKSGLVEKRLETGYLPVG